MSPGAWEAFDRLGDDFVRRAERSAYNAHYDRPAVLAALGPVRGLRVLDAACGPGVYAERLVADGATVVGFDASEGMVERARARLGGTATIDRLRIDEPLPYADASFDRVVCTLAIHYSNDRRATFREFHRVLRPGGRAVVSTQNPFVDWLRKGGSYFRTQQETDVWPTERGEVAVTFWHEPLSALCGAATATGFVLDLLDEPLPAPTMRQLSPDDFETLSQRPDFLVLGLRKLADPPPS
jgi:SAM-dependent methyltransferase